MRTTAEIEIQIGLARDSFEEGSRYPGMSYEQGVEDALMWVIGQSDDEPMVDD